MIEVINVTVDSPDEVIISENSKLTDILVLNGPTFIVIGGAE